MANKGSALEEIVKLIQETLKDSPNTVIHKNYKIKNSSGRKREFDVFIETEVNGIDIKIAIECKAYSHSVSVDKIEAFKGKCDRIPSINKKVFVSQSGYQTDAINAAKEFGIEICHLNEFSKEEILKWFPISQLGLRFTVKTPRLVVDTDENELSKLGQKNFAEFYINEDNKFEVIKFLNDAIIQDKKRLWGIAIMDFLKKGGSKSIGQPTTLPYQVQFNSAYILSDAGVKYPLVGIEGEIDFWLIETPLNVANSQTFNLNDEIKAGRLTISSGNEDRTDIIITKDKFKIFQTDENGMSVEFGVIATYDPKTGKFEKKNE